MMKSEWERAIKHYITDEEWDIVHRVYQTHPLISDVDGKKDLLRIYEVGGFGLISSMLPDADAAMIEESYRLYVVELAEFKARFVPKDR
jgi:hypothetical protein